MSKKLTFSVVVVMILSLALGACATPTPETVEVIKTVTVKEVVTAIVEVAGTPEVQEVVKEVIVTATPEPKEQKLEIFHWWTAPGEREAADAMFAALADKYPEIRVVENPVP
ncbi:MAG: hypothetical protein JW862_06020, partial [Anaerolineales bacterium]|nr:hypothetical protein [Anaerolineales bacterium]